MAYQNLKESLINIKILHEQISNFHILTLFSIIINNLIIHPLLFINITSIFYIYNK